MKKLLTLLLLALLASLAVNAWQAVSAKAKAREWGERREGWSALAKKYVAESDQAEEELHQLLKVLEREQERSRSEFKRSAANFERAEALKLALEITGREFAQLKAQGRLAKAGRPFAGNVDLGAPGWKEIVNLHQRTSSETVPILSTGSQWRVGFRFFPLPGALAPKYTVRVVGVDGYELVSGSALTFAFGHSYFTGRANVVVEAEGGDWSLFVEQHH